MMRRAFSVAIVLGAVLALVGVGTAGAAARDVARITGVHTSGGPLHVDDTFTIDVSARDRGANDYAVSFFEVPPGVTSLGQTCRGTQTDSPSPDVPSCEYDSFTTTTATVTHTLGLFRVESTPTDRIRIKVCAQSLSGSQATPDCRRVTIRAVEDRARILDVRTPARPVHVGQIFTIEILARDLGSTNYSVGFDHGLPAGVTLIDETCQGMGGADTPDCEYPAFGVTTSTITHTIGYFQADATTAAHINIDVCTFSFSTPPPKSDCRTVSIRVR